MLSIDQNSHSLWDTLPKLQALAAAGHEVRHFIEDIDVAYTSLGGGDSDRPHLARERFHHSGGADWGAAMFYSEFLGKLPLDPRDLEPFTGLKTAALAKQLGQSVEDLYDEFSPSDNWQLVGSSYVGDHRHHRVVGDLTVAESADALRELMTKARADTLRAFPAADCRRRTEEWFDAEDARLAGWLTDHAAGKLVDVYAAWLGHYLGASDRLELTSDFFAGGLQGGDPLLDAFLTDYDHLAGLYNEAVAETDVKLRPLKTSEGELPFFAAFEHQGHFVRAGAFLQDGRLVIGEQTFPLVDGRAPTDALRAAGVRCLAGKAIVLVIQVRTGPRGGPLALPHQGSLYIPAAHRLAEKLSAAGVLTEPLHPIVRVRLGLLERMKSLDVPIRLPGYLADAFGAEEIPASQLGAEYADLATAAVGRLESLTTPAGRDKWRGDQFPELVDELAGLDQRRRQLAEGDPDPAEIRPLSHRVRQVQRELLERSLQLIARDYHVSRLDYWDSRGAVLPWAISLGGEKFYNDVIHQARIYPEPAGADHE